MKYKKAVVVCVQNSTSSNRKHNIDSKAPHRLKDLRKQYEFQFNSYGISNPESPLGLPSYSTTFKSANRFNQSFNMMLSNSNILVALAALTHLTAGVALPQPDPAPEAVAAPELDKREVNGANCWKNHDDYHAYFRLSTWGTWDQDWGQGLLDNIRGQCGQYGNVELWGFGYESGAPPTNGIASFYVGKDAYWSHCVQDAVWLASNGAGQAIEGMTCWESNKWW